MSAFIRFEQRIRTALARRDDLKITVDRPRVPNGVWFLTVTAPDGYVIEIEWNRHRGFGLVAGWNLAFGSGVDEIVGSEEAAADRVLALVATPAVTSSESPIDLGELRKLSGFLQKDVAAKLGISKSALAQQEQAEALASMQVDTLQRIVGVLGGRLVISVDFPAGRRRRLCA